MTSPSEQSPPVSSSTHTTDTASARRDFVKGAVAVCAGVTALAAPLAVGGVVFLDPVLRRKAEGSEAETANASPSSKSGFVKVTTLESLSEVEPKLFKVYSNRSDAWNAFTNVPIGGVFLKLTGPKTVIAWNSRCPHLGCSVEMNPGGDGFLCPCHMGKFDPEGKRINEISPRDLDKLEVDVQGDDVWVQFKNYRQGISDKVEIS